MNHPSDILNPQCGCWHCLANALKKGHASIAKRCRTPRPVPVGQHAVRFAGPAMRLPSYPKHPVRQALAKPYGLVGLCLIHPQLLADILQLFPHDGLGRGLALRHECAQSRGAEQEAGAVAAQPACRLGFATSHGAPDVHHKFKAPSGAPKRGSCSVICCALRYIGVALAKHGLLCVWCQLSMCDSTLLCSCIGKVCLASCCAPPQLMMA